MQSKSSRRRSSARRVVSGFTLVEVLVAAMIVAILAAMAYPSYQESIRKARRGEGRAALMQLMQQQERYFSQATTYIEFSATSIDANAKKFKWFSADAAATSAYEISGQVCANETLQDCIMLSASPGTARVNVAFVDPHCGTLTFTSTGIKSAAASDCW